MAKEGTKKIKKPKAEKETVSAQTEKTAASGQPSATLEVTVIPKQLAKSEQTGAILISQDKFQEKIQVLRDQTTIMNDKDENVPF